MGLLNQSGNAGSAASSSPAVAAIDDTVCAPSPGSYLTDGARLFLVTYAISDSAKGELYLELEDCGTLEIVLCPVRALAELGLRAVSPPNAA